MLISSSAVAHKAVPVVGVTIRAVSL